MTVCVTESFPQPNRSKLWFIQDLFTCCYYCGFILELFSVAVQKLKTNRKYVSYLVTTHYNCTSPMDYISHHALHTHIPVHHYTNHTAVTIHSLVLIASPHLHLILTLTYKQHTYTHPLRSLVFPWLTFPSGFPLCVYLCTTWTVDSLSWSFAACLTDPACLLVILSVCCLPWSISLPLFMSLSYLRCPQYHYLIFACLTTSINKAAIGLTTLPLHYNMVPKM